MLPVGQLGGELRSMFEGVSERLSVRLWQPDQPVGMVKANEFDGASPQYKFAFIARIESQLFAFVPNG